jgi:ankyrin repeat protein
MVAAESGSVDELQRLLDSGAKVDDRDELSRTALTYAARGGRDAHVEALMRAGADARTRGLWDVEGGSMSALDAALIKGATQTAQLMQREVLQSFLVLEAADLSAIDEAGDTPLHWVARYADARATRLLVERGAHLEIRNCPARSGDERGLHADDLRSATPLLVAVWAGNPAVVRLLLESKANARAVDERGRGAFHVMRHIESVSLSAELLRAGADPMLPDRDGKTPAEALSASGLRVELARALAAAGRPIPSAPLTLGDLIGVIKRLGSTRGTTAPEDDPAPVLALLEEDAMLVNETDSQGRSPLFEAAFQGLPRVTETLLARGARVDARDANGATALHRARNQETITLLVRLGASVDARDHGGATPLHVRAAAPGSLDAVTALVAAGANTRLEDRGKKTPLDLAQASGSPDVIEYLERQR